MRDSTTYRQALSRLNLRPAGGNYAQLRKYIRESKLDTTHFTGQGWSRGQKCPRPMRSLAEIMTEDSDYHSFGLKQRLFAAGLKPRSLRRVWLGHDDAGWLSSSRVLDHINGNSRDNRFENLQGSLSELSQLEADTSRS